jgi:folate-binding protein YgfZ
MMSALQSQLIDFGQIRDDRFALARTLEDDIAALRVGAAVPLLASSVLRVTGADRLDFVQGQLSNDVKGLPVGGVTRALMLNHKGHALADVRVLRREGDLILIVEGGKGGIVRKSLEDHIIFDAVALHDADDVHVTLQGERVMVLLGELGADIGEGHYSADATLGAHWFFCRRSDAQGVDGLVPKAQLAQFLNVLTHHNFVLAGEDALLTARVVAGIPAVETEAGEGVLPQEAGLEQAVSYRKGCYLGQEIMARIEARGKLRRSLAQLQFVQNDVSGLVVGADVMQRDKVVGRLGAFANHPERGAIALAVVRNDLGSDRVTVGGLEARLHYLIG